MSRLGLLAALGLLGWGGLAACRPQTPAPAAPAPSPAAESAPVPEPAATTAMKRFEDAQRLIIAEQDIEAGIARLEEAVALDPGFAEAWYQLGTARLTAATAARPVDAAHALALWRSGVADCRRALELAERGSLRVWDAFELSDARLDMQEILGLAGDEKRLADDAAALAALDRWAELKGLTPEPGEPPGREERP